MTAITVAILEIWAKRGRAFYTGTSVHAHGTAAAKAAKPT